MLRLTTKTVDGRENARVGHVGARVVELRLRLDDLRSGGGEVRLGNVVLPARLIDIGLTGQILGPKPLDPVERGPRRGEGRLGA